MSETEQDLKTRKKHRRLFVAAAVVISHSWSICEDDLELLEQRCGKPVIFPSSGYLEY